MCQAYYSNCRGALISSDKLPLPCKEKIHIFDWKLCEKTHTRSVCEPTFHPASAGNIGQCEDCEKIEKKRKPGHLVEKSSTYRVHCPSREPPSYAPRPYMAPIRYFKNSASSVARPVIAARTTTYLQLPPMSQFAVSLYGDGFQQRRRATEESYSTAQLYTPFPSRSLRSSASNESPDINNIDPASSLQPSPTPTYLESPYVCTQGRAISTKSGQQPIKTPIDPASFVRPPPMHLSLESPYVCTQGRAISTKSGQQPIKTPIDPASLVRPPPMHLSLESPYVYTQCRAARTNSEQQSIQDLPPVAQAFNCRKFNGYSSQEGDSSLEPRVLGLRSQWFENESKGSQKSSTWNKFSGWVRKAGEKMTGQGRSSQKARQLSRSEQLARQPRVKPQRGGMETWIASSSNLDHGEQSVAWTY